MTAPGVAALSAAFGAPTPPMTAAAAALQNKVQDFFISGTPPTADFVTALCQRASWKEYILYATREGGSAQPDPLITQRLCARGHTSS